MACCRDGSGACARRLRRLSALQHHLPETIPNLTELERAKVSYKIYKSSCRHVPPQPALRSLTKSTVTHPVIWDDTRLNKHPNETWIQCTSLLQDELIQQFLPPLKLRISFRTTHRPGWTAPGTLQVITIISRIPYKNTFARQRPSVPRLG